MLNFPKLTSCTSALTGAMCLLMSQTSTQLRCVTVVCACCEMHVTVQVAILLLPLWAFRAGYRVTFTFTYYDMFRYKYDILRQQCVQQMVL